MDVKIEMSEKDIREAIYAWIKKEIGVGVDPVQVKIQVKSKQNYKSEWEEASFRALFAVSRIESS